MALHQRLQPLAIGGGLRRDAGGAVMRFHIETVIAGAEIECRVSVALAGGEGTIHQRVAGPPRFGWRLLQPHQREIDRAAPAVA